MPVGEQTTQRVTWNLFFVDEAGIAPRLLAFDCGLRGFLTPAPPRKTFPTGAETGEVAAAKFAAVGSGPDAEQEDGA